MQLITSSTGHNRFDSFPIHSFILLRWSGTMDDNNSLNVSNVKVAVRVRPMNRRGEFSVRLTLLWVGPCASSSTSSSLSLFFTLWPKAFSSHLSEGTYQLWHTPNLFGVCSLSFSAGGFVGPWLICIYRQTIAASFLCFPECVFPLSASEKVYFAPLWESFGSGSGKRNIFEETLTSPPHTTQTI